MNPARQPAGSDDDGHAISYKVLARGTPVRTSDGVEYAADPRAGRVRRMLGGGWRKR